MPTLGSDGGFQADNRGGIIDDQGNTIVTADTSFAASPLGVAARTQALYGIPNANFNLTPPDADAPIVANQNDLPYWSIEDLSDGQITATTVFDDATQTYGLELNPGTAATDSSLTLSTRSYILTDDNLALRQKALSVLSKSGTAGGTASQWNLQLSAIYYDANNTALSTAVIGTALDTATWTSFSGTTTPGGSAINSSAQYVDLTYTLATTAAVTGSVKATIKSLLLTTSTPAAGGGGGLIISDAYTSSGTWTRPAGVDYLLAVVAIGAGGGGGGGAATSGYVVTNGSGGGGGGGGRWAIARDLYVGNVGSVSIGIGAGGGGGAGTSFSKAAGGTADLYPSVLVGANGAAGGATTFGAYLSVPGGGAGTGGGTATRLGGTIAGTATFTVFDTANLGGGAGGSAVAGTAGSPGAAGSATAFSQLSYTPSPTAGATPSASTGTANGSLATVYIGAAGAGGSAGWNGGGGGGGGYRNSPLNGFAGGAGGNGGAGGGGGGAFINFAGTVGAGTTPGGTVTGATGGSGFNGGGGGGGAAAAFRAGGSQQLHIDCEVSVQSGAGGSGANGIVYVIYVG
jgi:hypothetical protein